MEKNLFQQAKDAMTNLMNIQHGASEEEQRTAESAIEAAYENASPEEQQQLKQLEQQIKQNNHLN